MPGFLPDVGQFVLLRTDAYVRVMIGTLLLWAVSYVGMRVWVSRCVAYCRRQRRLHRLPEERRMRVVERLVSRALERSWMLPLYAMFSLLSLVIVLAVNTVYVAGASPVTRLIWGVTWLCSFFIPVK